MKLKDHIPSEFKTYALLAGLLHATIDNVKQELLKGNIENALAEIKHAEEEYIPILKEIRKKEQN